MQIEIFELLRNIRMSGDESFFTPSQIRSMLKEHYDNGLHRSKVAWSLAQLEAFGYLEVELLSKRNNWNRKYRVKAKYLTTGGDDE